MGVRLRAKTGGVGKNFNRRCLAVLVSGKRQGGCLNTDVDYAGARQFTSLLLKPVKRFSPTVIQDNVIGNQATSEQGFHPHEEDLTR